jgi:hypothetical protein
VDSLAAPALSENRPWPIRTPLAFERPWSVPAARLIELLRLEARPKAIALLGHDSRTLSALRQAFPLATVIAVEPHDLDRADGFDAILCVCGLSWGFDSDTALIERLTAKLPIGGHLALMEVRGTTRALGRLLDTHLVPLHQTEERSWMGLWRHILYVGRKGTVIR